MSRREYTGKELVVTFDARRCIHTGICLRAAPNVFDLNAKPWILADNASADEVAEAVAKCPSGALQFRRLDGGAEETSPEVTHIITKKDGPLVVRGKLEMADHEGNTIDVGPRATLCRCGQSANKPFCDNSHKKLPRSEP